MYDIELTEDFSKWFDSLRDSRAQKTILKRLRTMSLGTLGDVRSLGGSLFEAKIHYGQGYRLYFINRGKKIIVILCGGDKSTQNRDIKNARKLAKEI